VEGYHPKNASNAGSCPQKHCKNKVENDCYRQKTRAKERQNTDNVNRSVG
jgi:hypothetical protein